MSVNITMPSENISIFPATRRDYVYQRDARQFNEKNIVNITNKLVDKDSYVITTQIDSEKPFEFVLHGYYINIPKLSYIIAIMSASNASNIYAYIEMDCGNEYEEIAGQDADNGKGVSYYSGLKFTDTKPSDDNIHSLLILKKKNSSEDLSTSNVEIPKESNNKFNSDSTEGLTDFIKNTNEHKENTDIHITAEERKKWDDATQRTLDLTDSTGSLRQEFNDHVADKDIHITAKERETWNDTTAISLRNHNVVETVLVASQWKGSAAPYTYELEFKGCQSNDVPEIGTNIENTAYTTAKTVKKNFAFIYKADTQDDKIMFYAYKLPTIDIPISVKGAGTNAHTSGSTTQFESGASWIDAYKPIIKKIANEV